jgi:oligopeptide/dipeptide ABC transporter ATP-binding protein
MSEALVAVKDLAKHFHVPRARLFDRARVLRAVDGVGFDVKAGEILGIVGESGCGKSTLARLILRLIEPTRGEVRIGGTDITRASRNDLRKLRREMQLVFQDPLASLNPRMPIGIAIAEPLRFHGIGSAAERHRAASELLDVVGLSRNYFDRLPHEFSGGQCQRVGIARALILKPKLVVLDEPVSALDVSVRAQILSLLLELRREFGLTYVLISHDLGVVKRICDRTAVLYLGKIVELAPSEALYREPLHPYTRALIGAIPTPDPQAARVDDLASLEGDVPSPIDPPKGCRFHTRCPHRMDICTRSEPPHREIRPGHVAACFLHEAKPRA